MYLFILKTNVMTARQGRQLHPLLMAIPSVSSYNFDLQDCDHILRVVSTVPEPGTVCSVVQGAGHTCVEMESFVYPEA